MKLWRWREGERRLLEARCSTTGAYVRTHAHMTAAELSRFKSRRLVYFCPACRTAHTAAGAELRFAKPH